MMPHPGLPSDLETEFASDLTQGALWYGEFAGRETRRLALLARLVLDRLLRAVDGQGRQRPRQGEFEAAQGSVSPQTLGFVGDGGMRRQETKVCRKDLGLSDGWAVAWTAAGVGDDLW